MQVNACMSRGGPWRVTLPSTPGFGWAIRRYVYIRLIHDEKGTPMHRRFLKMKKMIFQKGLCAICRKKLPKKGAELDRCRAMLGYTEKNMRLVHHKCHGKSKEEKGFA